MLHNRPYTRERSMKSLTILTKIKLMNRRRFDAHEYIQHDGLTVDKDEITEEIYFFENYLSR